MEALSRSVLEQLDAVRAEGERRGFRYGLDFAIAQVPVGMSSEVILLDAKDGVFVVYYRDMGKNREVARGVTVAEVREPFLEEVARLAGPRGRGPYVGEAPPSPNEGLTPRQVYEQMQARGFFAGQPWPGGG